MQCNTYMLFLALMPTTPDLPASIAPRPVLPGARLRGEVPADARHGGLRGRGEGRAVLLAQQEHLARNKRRARWGTASRLIAPPSLCSGVTTNHYNVNSR